jgi:hypothetical protein
MDTSGLKWSAVSPLRLLKLFGIVVGSIILLEVVAVVGYAEWPLVTSPLWHMLHGNTVELEGHSFRVPLLYEPEESEGGRQIDIIQRRRLFTGGSSVTIQSGSKALDLGSINRWQAALIDTANNHRATTFRWVPLTLHGKKLTFVCVDLTVGGESLMCNAVGTGLTVSTWASPGHVKEIRAIVEGSE